MSRKGLAVLGVVLVAALFMGSGSSSLPKGKGVFIIDLPSQGPEYLIERLKYLGITWVAIEISWYGPPGPASSHDALGTTHNLENGRLAAFVPQLVAAGIQCWVWGFPSPDRQDAFVDNVRHAYQVAPALSGTIIDPEKPYYAPEFGAALEDLISRLKDMGRPVGVTSYGLPSYHPAFPWEAVGDADFGMPQLYSELGPAYLKKGDTEWRAMVGYVVPLNGVSSAHTPSGIQQQAADTVTKDGAIGFWTLGHALASSGRAEAVRSISV